ncbi:MAG: zinc ribbon domain-containing protein, partial [Lactobacillus sp.]|nr:zinc ribbon domain-containing protein [Lactobacillus sp.]
MECFHCGQQNNDDAVFCKQCGQRVDGKEQCPSCGQLIDCDSQFCECCGCNLQESNLDTELKDGAYAESVFVNKSARLKRKGETCCAIFSLAAVFFSLLFTFFIGISFSSSQIASSDISFLPSFEVNLYYYFGECYKHLDLIKELGLSNFFTSHYYFYAIFGTLLSLAIMLSVAILAIITLTKYINYAKGKNDNSYFKYALTTYITYILGLTLFCAFNGNCGRTNSDIISFEPNGYSIFGIIMTTACVIPAIVGKTSTLGAQLSAQRNVSKISFAALSVVVLAFLLILTATPSITVNTENNSVHYNFFTAMTLVATIFSFKEPTVSPVSGMVIAPEPPMELYSNLLFGLIFQTAIIITVLIMIVAYINSMSTNKKERTYAGVGASAALAMLSIIYLILTINAQSQFIEYLDSDAEDISADALSLALTALIGIVKLVISICHTVTDSRIIKRSNC